jgi:hypothetical protein
MGSAPCAALRFLSRTFTLDCPTLNAFLRTWSATMPVLALSREVFEVLSKSLGFIPIVGENLKSAAELASKICEEIQVREHLPTPTDHGCMTLLRDRPSKRIAKATSYSVAESRNSFSPYRVSLNRRRITSKGLQQGSRSSRI